MASGAARASLGAGLCTAAAALIYVLAYHAGVGLDADNRVLESFGGLETGSVELRAGSLTEFLNTLPFAIAVAIVLAAAVVTGGLRTVAAAAAIFAGANLTTQVLQVVTDSPRVDGFFASTQWPSGHACAATSLAVCVVLVTPARLRAITAALGTLGLLTVAFSILRIGSHRISEVLAGMLVAGAWTGLVAAALALMSPAPGAGARGAAWASAAAGMLALVALSVIVLGSAPVRRDLPPIAVCAVMVAALGAAVVACAARLPAPSPPWRVNPTPTR